MPTIDKLSLLCLHLLFNNPVINTLYTIRYNTTYLLIKCEV